MEKENNLVNGNMLRRGALIVFEGCDRAGKSTQCKKLIEALNKRNIPAKGLSFPDRTTDIGKIIDNYLSRKGELSDKAVHLLFSANRWEMESHMTRMLSEGTTLIVDRYSYSGVAFSAAKEGMDMEWCKAPEAGLPRPDLVFFLDLSSDTATNRGDFGNERYEVSEFQNKVRNNFNELQDGSWQVINADQDVESIHNEVLNLTLKAVESSKMKHLSSLW